MYKDVAVIFECGEVWLGVSVMWSVWLSMLACQGLQCECAKMWL